MRKFTVKFNREFEVGIEAENLEVAQALSRQIIANFPPETARVLSIIEEGVDVIVSSPAAQAEMQHTRLAGGIDDLPV
jgi:hypothetical protein